MSDNAPQEKLPTGKIERASKFLKTGAKVGGNYLKYYGQKALLQNPSRESLDQANAEDLLEGMTELRGTALKVAQMMSMDQVNLSPTFTNVLAKAQYQVPPMSAPLAMQVFSKSLGKSPEEIFDRFEPQAVKAASMGQVHMAWKDGQQLAVKIQYPGVADSIQSDLRIVKAVVPRFVNTTSAEIEPYFQEVEARLLEEADYGHELRVSMEFAQLCGHIPGVAFPQYLPQYSSDRVLTMTWLEGMHLKDFLASVPTDIVQKAAQNLWDLYAFQVHEMKRVQADPHPGNFLFRPDGTVGVLDFGCTKLMSDTLYRDYFCLADPTILSDNSRLLAALHKLDILRPDDSPAKIEQVASIFSRLVGLLTAPLREGRFYFNNPDYFKAISDLGFEIKDLKEVRGSKEFLFVNRTFFGLFTLMQAMDATVDTRTHYLDWLFRPTTA